MMERVNAALRGWPDDALGGLLIALGVVLILAGLFASPAVKLPMLLWVVLP